MKCIGLTGCIALIAACSLADETNAPTLDLATAEQIALKNHPAVAAADYRARAAQEVVKEAQAGYFPKATLYANAVGAGSSDVRILAGGLNNPSVFDRAAAGVAVSQLITDFGRTANAAAGSKFQARAENDNANATRGRILLDVDVNYFNALKAQAVLSVARQTFDTRRVLLDQISTMASNQLRSEVDVSFARVSVEESQLLVQKAENDLSAAMTSLSTSLGSREPKPYQLVEQPLATNVVADDIQGLVQTALESRPEVLSLRNAHEAAVRLARSKRDARLPEIDAVGVAGGAPVHDDRLPDDYAAAGIQLDLPLFAGGFYLAQQREAELKAEAESEALRDLEDQVVRDVHLASLNLNNAWRQLSTTRELIRSATEAYDLAEARYRLGSSSIVELSQAQLGLTSALIAEANARYDVLAQQANLAYQTGTIH